MRSLPQCHQPLYPKGGGTKLVIAVVGSPAALNALRPLPVISSHIQWVREALPSASSPVADLTFVLWEKGRRREIADFLAQGTPGLGAIVIHHCGESVPDVVVGARFPRLSYAGDAAADIASATRMLVAPLLYRSEVCVAYEDLAFMLQRSGQIVRWGPLLPSAFRLPLKLQELACGACTYALVLIPERDSSDLWPTVETLGTMNADVLLIAAHLHAGEEAAVWVMTVVPSQHGPAHEPSSMDLKASLISPS